MTMQVSKRSANFIKFALMLLGLILFVRVLDRQDKIKQLASHKLLQNHIIFTGKVTGIKVSSNHSFGIITVNIITNTTESNFQSLTPKRSWPYSIKGLKAEIYARVPDGVVAGDSVRLDSDKETAYYYNYAGRKVTDQDIYIVTDPFDIEYITNNATL